MTRVVLVCGVAFAAASACSRPQAQARASGETPTAAVAPV